MLKVELHAHTNEDPLDLVAHSDRALIERAAALGYHALAITLHNRYCYSADAAAFAKTHAPISLPISSKAPAKPLPEPLFTPADPSKAVSKAK